MMVPETGPAWVAPRCASPAFGRAKGKAMQDSDTNSAPTNVRAVVRACSILQSFAEKNLQTLAEVSQATGLDKGTTRRLLVTLMSCGFVVQDPVSQRYGLGLAVRRIAANVSEDFGLRAVAVPLLTELAAELHITAFLSVFQDGAALALERIHDMRGMEVRWWSVGGNLPLNVGGAPKVLLAYQPPEVIEVALSRPLEAMTPASINDPDELRERLQLIRERGWELAIDDVALGLATIAVPILDRDHKLICAISIAGLTPQMVVRGKPRELERMLGIARRIEQQLGQRDAQKQYARSHPSGFKA